MRPTFGVLILLVTSGMALATEQVPDVLYYDGIKLSLRTGWGHPSPLETYYYQNRLAYPFRGHSTANYRGHVAVWKIQDAELYLSAIQTDSDPNGGHERVVKYGVASKTMPPSQNGDVLADWFSGILDCHTKTEGGYGTYFFHVRDGSIVDMQVITTEDYKTLSEPGTAHLWTEDLKNKSRMRILNSNYITYYYRLNEEDDIEYKGQNCRLETGYDRLSPLFGFYDDSHLSWPYNWENLDKSGAPHCRWRIEDDKLYLTGVELYSGLSFYSIDTEKLDLVRLFRDKVMDGVVEANWVSGVYVVKHGSVAQEDAGWPGYTFTVFNVTGYTYLRMKQGRLTESYTVPEDFDPVDLSEDVDPGLIRIIEDYRLPSVFGTSSTATERGTDQAQNALSSAQAVIRSEHRTLWALGIHTS